MSMIKQNNSGFTLVEMLMVILIIAATTKIVAVSTQEFAYSARYEQTQAKLDTLRQAIVGDSKRTINGQPDISGFVSDMGRLPDNIRELLQSFVCINTVTNTVLLGTSPNQCIHINETPIYLDTPCSDNVQTNKTACEALLAPNNTWVGKQSDTSSGLHFGWNGTYLHVSDNPNRTDTYTDGWGNESANNYGWQVLSDTPFTGDLTITSLGKDGLSDTLPCGANTYDGDCATVILKRDYSIDISGGLSVQLTTDYSNICQQDNSTKTACYANGGHWETCLLLTRTQCTAAGGSWGSDCRMTQAVCTGKGGTWNGASNPQCVFTSTNCPTVGGTWSATDDLCHFTATACVNAGGYNSITCLFNASSCSGAGKTWEPANHHCSFTSVKCASVGGIDKTVGANASCLRSYKDQATGLAYSQSSCLADGFGWVGGNRSVSLCMRIYYRHNGSITSIASSAISVVENGVMQQLHFSGFPTSATVPMGINAVGIYQHDGTNCTNNLYPSYRTQALPVAFVPQSHLPMIYW